MYMYYIIISIFVDDFTISLIQFLSTYAVMKVIYLHLFNFFTLVYKT